MTVTKLSFSQLTLYDNTYLILEDKCYPNPCQHEGLCYLDNDINNENGFNCYCKTGYHGDTCQIGNDNHLVDMNFRVTFYLSLFTK